MSTAPTVPTTRPTARPTPPRKPTPAEREPIAGRLAYRLAQLLVLGLLVTVVPFALAVGLGWLPQEHVVPLTPILRKVAAVTWGLSLVGLALSVGGLSEFGSKRRTLIALAVHALLAFGPLLAALR